MNFDVLMAAREAALEAGDFGATFELDNLLEQHGMHADGRVTCWACRVFADEDHAHDVFTGQLIAAR